MEDEPMNRNEWGNMVGDNADIVDDLRWRLFQAERAIARITADRVLRCEILPFKAYHEQARDARCALAALWTRGE